MEGISVRSLEFTKVWTIHVTYILKIVQSLVEFNSVSLFSVDIYFCPVRL